MTDMDIIGKEFTAVPFEKDGILTCSDAYDRFIGKTGIVTNTNVDYPRFARVEFDDSGYVNALHWPVKVIEKQLQENLYKETPEYTKDLFKEILKLTKIK
jgi:uncharacterized membrane-anchored protein